MANLHFQLSWYNEITLLPPPTQHHSFFRNFHPLSNLKTTSAQIVAMSVTDTLPNIKWDEPHRIIHCGNATVYYTVFDVMSPVKSPKRTRDAESPEPVIPELKAAPKNIDQKLRAPKPSWIGLQHWKPGEPKLNGHSKSSENTRKTPRVLTGSGSIRPSTLLWTRSAEMPRRNYWRWW